MSLWDTLVELGPALGQPSGLPTTDGGLPCLAAVLPFVAHRLHAGHGLATDRMQAASPKEASAAAEAVVSAALRAFHLLICEEGKEVVGRFPRPADFMSACLAEVEHVTGTRVHADLEAGSPEAYLTAVFGFLPEVSKTALTTAACLGLHASGPLASIAIDSLLRFHGGHLGLRTTTAADLDYIRRVVPFVPDAATREEARACSFPPPVIPLPAGGQLGAHVYGALGAAPLQETAADLAAAHIRFPEPYPSPDSGDEDGDWQAAACRLLPSVLLQAAAPHLGRVSPWTQATIAFLWRSLARSPVAAARYAALVGDFLAHLKAAAPRLQAATLNYIHARAVEAGLLTGVISLTWPVVPGGGRPSLGHGAVPVTAVPALASLVREVADASEAGRLAETSKPASDPSLTADSLDHLPPTNTLGRYVWDARHRLTRFASGMRDPLSFLPSPWLGGGLHLTHLRLAVRETTLVSVPASDAPFHYDGATGEGGAPLHLMSCVFEEGGAHHALVRTPDGGWREVGSGRTHGEHDHRPAHLLAFHGRLYLYWAEDASLQGAATSLPGDAPLQDSALDLVTRAAAARLKQ